MGELIKNRILIGHALKGDLAVLNLSHPRQAQRDTSLYEPFRIQYGSRRTPSLQKVVKGELEVNIQVSEHDSVLFYLGTTDLRSKMHRLPWRCIEKCRKILKCRFE